jgi:hypothetical protein
MFKQRSATSNTDRIPGIHFPNFPSANITCRLPQGFVYRDLQFTSLAGQRFAWHSAARVTWVGLAERVFFVFRISQHPLSRAIRHPTIPLGYG